MKDARASVDVFPIHPADINIKLMCERKMPDGHRRVNDRFHVKRAIRSSEDWLMKKQTRDRSKRGTEKNLRDRGVAFIPRFNRTRV